MLAEAYEDIEEIVLSIDGLQPEKGHETLYVVRELTQKRVWFAESLISSSEAEVRRLIVRARQWAERLGKRVRAWVSAKQDAFLKGIAAEFPGVAHRYCENHFLRDLAKPVLEADSHAKVQMRRKVRGLRPIEREVLDRRREQEAGPEENSSRRDDQPEPSDLSEEGRAVSWTSFAFHVRGRPSSDAIAHERCEGDLGAAGGSGAEADLAVHARRRDRGRELYPDVDFYSGILLQLMGISTNMFTVCFGIDR